MRNTNDDLTLFEEFINGLDFDAPLPDNDAARPLALVCVWYDKTPDAWREEFDRLKPSAAIERLNAMHSDLLGRLAGDLAARAVEDLARHVHINWHAD